MNKDTRKLVQKDLDTIWWHKELWKNLNSPDESGNTTINTSSTRGWINRKTACLHRNKGGLKLIDGNKHVNQVGDFDTSPKKKANGKRSGTGSFWIIKKMSKYNPKVDSVSYLKLRELGYYQEYRYEINT